MIRIIFLGTAGATPTKARALPSIAIEYDGEIYLFDCGEGTQRQFLKYNINLSKISSIFLSHVHADHVIGIVGLIRTLAINKRIKPLFIYIPKNEENKIRTLINFDNPIINFEIIVNGISTGRIIKNKKITVSSFKLNHSVLTYGYVFKENDKIHFFKNKSKELGLRGKMFAEILNKKQITIKNKLIKLSDISFLETGKKIIYATDTRPCKSTIKNSMNADVLIHETTYIEKLKNLAKERKHSTTLETANIAKQSNVKKLIVFHISARYKNANILLKEIKAVFKNSEIAKDGLIIELK
ncbi:MAG: ribonuclease Z [Candidatus Marsarchaeota archaeon]|nr:ribonuclease Z [Candidatus Marsarchaeota archaeon]MCL5094699.1 ribonuclease Z [Candidatus Marsarchaeota archaeon]